MELKLHDQLSDCQNNCFLSILINKSNLEWLVLNMTAVICDLPVNYWKPNLSLYAKKKRERLPALEKCIKSEDKKSEETKKYGEVGSFYCVLAFYFWQSVIYQHGALMEEVKKGGENRAREYQYEFFIWWILWGTAFQRPGRVKVHGRMKAVRNWKGK